LSTPESKIVIAIETLLRGLPKAERDLDRFTKKLQNTANVKPRDTAQSFSRATQGAEKQAQAFRKLQLASAELDARQKRLEASQLRNANAMERARLAAARLERQKLSLSRSSGTLEKSLGKIGTTLNRAGSGLQSFGRTLSVALTAPLAALGIVAVDSAKDIDAEVNTLKAFTGGAEAAEVRLQELIKTAGQTPGLTTSLGLMLDSQLRLAKVTVSTIDKVLPAIGRLNAVQQIEDPARFSQNLVQLVSQNFERTDLKELVGQSPVAGQIIAELLNVDSPVNAKAVRESAKKMGLTTTDAFFTAFAEAASRNQALNNVTESIGSQLAKQADRLTFALRPLGLAILNAITPAINALIPVVEKLSNGFANLPQPGQQALLVIGGLAALLGPALVLIGGLVTGLGSLAGAIGVVASVIGTIGLPALAALIGGVVAIIGEWVAILAALGLAWKTNFLNIRGLVTSAAAAVLSAFQRIRAVIQEAVQRILPDLQSITAKVLGFITAAWERYGKSVVEVISKSFEVITRTVEAFLRFFGNVVDLIVKLIDGDWRGAWRAFSRIIINALDSLSEFFSKAIQIIDRGMKTMVAFIIRQAFAFADAGASLASRLILSLAATFIAGSPQISDALSKMILLAAADVALGPAAGIIRTRLIAEMRKAAAEGLAVGAGSAALDTANLGPNVGPSAGIFRQKSGRGAGGSSDGKGDKQAANALRKAQKELAKAQTEFADTEAQNRIALTRAGIEQQLALTQDGLNRESEALKNSFDERTASVRKYFEERKRLEEAQIDAELAKEKGLSRALDEEFAERRKQIQREFTDVVEEINRDPKLKGRAKEIALQTAEQEKQTKLAKEFNDWETQGAEISTRILLLQKKRKDVATDLTREERNLLKEIGKQETELSAELLDEQGSTADAAAIRLRQRFKDTIEELRVDVSGLTPELQAAFNNVDISTLRAHLEELPQPVRDLLELLDIASKRAVIQQQSVDVERTLAELRLHETTIQNKVLDGVVSEKDARAAILAIQGLTRDRLLDTLQAQLQLAESTKGQEDEALRIRAQIQEVQRLGAVIDGVGQQINQDLFSDIEQGFEGIFQNARRGFDGLKDAAISFGESLLNTLNKIAAQSITDKLEGIFKPAAGDTKGTPGGFLSKLFGLQPKVADTTAATALASAGTAAGTALTTGGTAAATALTTSSAMASTTWLSSVATSAASFASSIIAAGAAFAASVAAGAGAQAVGGLGSAFAAATGIFPAVPGGMGHIVEGGYPEAVLTTDPKHAARQFEILKSYLAQTKGLFGRMPSFAAGGFITPRQAEMDLLGSVMRSPSHIDALPHAALAHAGGRSSEIRLRQILTTENLVPEFLNSPEGETIIKTHLMKNQHLISRLANRRS